MTVHLLYNFIFYVKWTIYQLLGVFYFHYTWTLTVWFISNNHMYSTIHFFRNATLKSKDCKTSYKVKIQSPTLHTKKNNCKQTNVAEKPKGNNFIWTCYILWHQTVYDTWHVGTAWISDSHPSPREHVIVK